MTRQFYIGQSLDGYIADTEGSVRWLEEAGAGGDYGYDAFFRDVGAVAMGAKTYEQLLGWDIPWPYSDVPSWVFTRRVLPTPEGADVRFVDAPPVDAIGGIDASAGGRNVWLVGGGRLARQWIADGLLDELILFVAPLLLGGGIRLFGDTVATALELTEAKTHPTGFAELRYRFPRPAS
jgi:dihydrofolate reductase